MFKTFCQFFSSSFKKKLFFYFTFGKFDVELLFAIVDFNNLDFVKFSMFFSANKRFKHFFQL